MWDVILIKYSRWYENIRSRYRQNIHIVQIYYTLYEIEFDGRDFLRGVPRVFQKSSDEPDFAGDVVIKTNKWIRSLDWHRKTFKSRFEHLVFVKFELLKKKKKKRTVTDYKIRLLQKRVSEILIHSRRHCCPFGAQYTAKIGVFRVLVRYTGVVRCRVVRVTTCRTVFFR